MARTTNLGGSGWHTMPFRDSGEAVDSLVVPDAGWVAQRGQNAPADSPESLGGMSMRGAGAVRCSSAQGGCHHLREAPLRHRVSGQCEQQRRALAEILKSGWAAFSGNRDGKEDPFGAHPAPSSALQAVVVIPMAVKEKQITRGFSRPSWRHREPCGLRARRGPEQTLRAQSSRLGAACALRLRT